MPIGRRAVATLALLLGLATLGTPAGAQPVTRTGAQPVAPATSGLVLDTPTAATLTVDHPSLPLRYEVLPEVVDARVVLRTLDVSDPARPREVSRTLIHAVTGPRSVAIDGAGRRLYVAVRTNTHVLDLQAATSPVLLGRMADYMIRTHEHVQTAVVDDAVLGVRDLLVISSRLGGGDGCWTGTVHVYDTTGALQDTPVDVLESDVPAVAAGTPCPAPVLRTDGAARRLSLTWDVSAGAAAGQSGQMSPRMVRRDHVPYDVTADYVALVGVCLIT